MLYIASAAQIRPTKFVTRCVPKVCHICAGTGAHPAASVMGLGLTPPTSAPGPCQVGELARFLPTVQGSANISIGKFNLVTTAEAARKAHTHGNAEPSRKNNARTRPMTSSVHASKQTHKRKQSARNESPLPSRSSRRAGPARSPPRAIPACRESVRSCTTSHRVAILADQLYNTYCIGCGALRRAAAIYSVGRYK